MAEEAKSAEKSEHKLSKRSKVSLIIWGILIALCCTLTLLLFEYTSDRKQISSGVILEIPLGQLTMEEAQAKLKQLKNNIYQNPVHFISEDENFQIKREELGFTYNYQEALQQAYLIGREGNIFNKAISKYKASWGITLYPKNLWNDSILEQVLTKNLSVLNRPAVDARFAVNPDNSLQIVPEKAGKQVNLDPLIASIKTQPLNDTREIPISFKDVQPSITKTVLENLKMNRLLSEYTTSFDSNLKERSLNIKLAAKAIDGLVLKPGEVFSFNKSVGPRTAEAGYQVAMIIEGDKFVPGLGGGVCQVSSTLYNAVQLASPDLSIVERSRHSLPITYVPLGQDATVAYPDLDFKFKNDSDDYLLIRSSNSDNTLTFRIYGNEKQ